MPNPESTPPPETNRAPLPADVALALAVEVTPHPVPAQAAPAQVALRDAKPPPWTKPLTLEGLAGRIDQVWTIAIGADNRTLQTEANVEAMRTSQSRVERGLNELRLSVSGFGELLENGFNGIKAAFKAREAADREQDDKIAKVEGADTEITKRISLTDEKLVVVEKKTNAFETWMHANPRITWWTGASTIGAALIGLADKFGPSVLNALAHAWAVAHGITPPIP